MRRIFIYGIFLASLVFINACNNAGTVKNVIKDSFAEKDTIHTAGTLSVAANTITPVAVNVKEAKGQMKILVNDKETALENLATTISSLLLQQEIIQDSVPVKYTGEFLMGTRGEISTEVNTGIKKAKAIKYKDFIAALTPAVKKEMKVEVALDVNFLKQEGDNVFITATMMDPAGYELELNKTSHAVDGEAGSFSTSVFGLLHKDGMVWKVTTTSIGATDVPCVCWWKEFNVPKSLFPKGVVAEECN